MNKKEKYIEFVANDIFRKTEVDYETRVVIDYPYNRIDMFQGIPVEHFISYDLPSIIFERYVVKLYGCTLEESYDIWVIYKNKLKFYVDR
jgi:hypothetical protein|tara:strand:+ start:275 stop:544 length:270 start_codon:yes stop_codon:yes gene_type:complete